MPDGTIPESAKAAASAAVKGVSFTAIPADVAATMPQDTREYFQKEEQLARDFNTPHAKDVLVKDEQKYTQAAHDLQELAAKTGKTTPQLHVSEGNTAVAVANKEGTHVGIGSQVFDKLDSAEIKWVEGHELKHIDQKQKGEIPKGKVATKKQEFEADESALRLTFAGDTKNLDVAISALKKVAAAEGDKTHASNDERIANMRRVESELMHPELTPLVPNTGAKRGRTGPA